MSESIVIPYKNILFKDFCEVIIKMPINTIISFSLDTSSDIETNGKPSKWRGISKANFFDEPNDLLIIGYWCKDGTKIYSFTKNRTQILYEIFNKLGRTFNEDDTICVVADEYDKARELCNLKNDNIQTITPSPKPRPAPQPKQSYPQPVVNTTSNSESDCVLKCPYCQSTNLSKISTASRAVSFSLFGFASGKVGKQWHCNNCKSDF